MKQNDYEQLYYDELYKNKELLQKIKDLEEELETLKKYSKNGNVKDLIIQELIRYKGVKYERVRKNFN